MGRASLLSSNAAERLSLAAALLAFFAAGYFGIGSTVDPTRARDLATAADPRIPFVAGSVWVYVAMYPAAFSPLVLVRCPRLYRRTALAYAVAIGLSLFAFAAFPVTSSALRASGAALGSASLSARAVSLLYRLDPPFNLFPSLHLSIAALAALSAWKAARVTGTLAGAFVAAIGLSVCTVKQHFVLDAVAGAALAGLIYAVVLRPYAPAPEYVGISSSRSRNAIK